MSTKKTIKTSKTRKIAIEPKPLFRGDYGVLFEMASHAAMPVGTFLRMASKAIHKSIQRVKYDLLVLANPNHRSNRNKSCNIARRHGWIRLAPFRALKAA